MSVTAEVVPGYVVTDVLYEQVRELLVDELPNLTWEQFTRPAGGALLVPAPDGEVSKLELILAAGPALTVKVNQWWRPDKRAGDRPAPHNHPWRTMRSRILAGGYADSVYWAEGTSVGDDVRDHDAGSDNVLLHHEFHEVVEVESGATWTCFVGDRCQPGDWGYLDPETAWFTHNSAHAPDPGFASNFHALNPHVARARPEARREPQPS